MKKYLSGKELRQKYLNGAKLVFDNVSSTMGPGGNLVFLCPRASSNQSQKPIATKDGWTVCAFLEAEDPFENIAVQVLKQSSERSNNQAGDGSTQVIVNTYSMLWSAMKYLTPGVSVNNLKKGMEEAVGLLTTELKNKAKKIKNIEEIENIATISANGDVGVGKIIAKAIDLVGKDGTVQIQESKSVQTSLDMIEGFRFSSGYLSPRFINNEKKGLIEHSEPLFFITDHKIETVEQMLPVLELAARENKPLVIMADEIVGQALAVLIANVLRGSMIIAAISPPKFGEERRMVLEDIAIATGSKFFSKISCLDFMSIQLKDFGRAKSIEAGKSHTTIIGGYGLSKDIKERVEIIKKQIEEIEDIKDCERYQERIAKLQGGIAVISVGGSTDIETIEKKHRIEDALNAAKSAMEEGIVPGGGVFLLNLQSILERPKQDLLSQGKIDMASGFKIIQDICSGPFNVILGNAGEDAASLRFEVLNRIDKEPNLCYDVVKKQFVDGFKEGLIDPVKVIRCALENSLSVVSILISSDHAVVED